MSSSKSPGNKLNNFYLIAGKDRYFIDDFIKQVIDKAFNGNPDTSAIGTFDFSGKKEKEKDDEDTIEMAIEYARTQSMFSSTKVVIIKEIYKLKKAELDKFLMFIDEIHEDTYVIAVTSGELTAARKKALKDMGADNTSIIDMNDIGAGDVRTWAKEYLKEKGKKMDPEVLSFIVDESNEETATIKNELDKMMLFVGDKEQIEKEDFNAVRGVDKNYDVWALTDAVMYGNESKAFEILENIYDDTPAELIMGSIFGAIKSSYEVIYYLNTNQRAKAQKKFFKRLYFLEKQAKNFSKVPYIEVLEVIKDTDKKVKLSSRDKAKVHITMMIQKLALLQKREKIDIK